MATSRLSRYCFYVIGIVLGVIIGIVLRWFVPQATISMDPTARFGTTSFLTFLFHIENPLLLIMIFFLTEIVLAMLMKKPHRVYGISIGLFIIPIVWAAIVEYPQSNMDISSRIVAYLFFSLFHAAVMVLLWYALFAISLSIPYLVGIDTSVMEDGRLLPQAFSFGYQAGKETSIDLVDILAGRIGFTRTSTQEKSGVKLSYYDKEKLKLSISQKSENNVSRVVFGFYSVHNDTVESYEEQDEIADYKSQVKALLELHSPQQVQGVGELSPLEQDLQLMAEGLCRRVLPARGQIKTLYKDFPNNHPYLFGLLLVVVGGVIVEVFRILLIH